MAVNANDSIFAYFMPRGLFGERVEADVRAKTILARSGNVTRDMGSRTQVRSNLWFPKYNYVVNGSCTSIVVWDEFIVVTKSSCNHQIGQTARRGIILI